MPPQATAAGHERFADFLPDLFRNWGLTTARHSPAEQFLSGCG